MACSAPITMATPYGNITTRCKQCLNCRIMKQSALTLRCLLENQYGSSASFWTLTYKDAPETGDYMDFSKFLNRFRSWNRRRGNKTPIRYLGVGEYGHKHGRFHYHALIWNALELIPETSLTRLWPHGFVYIGTVTPASIRYTARYTLKFETKGKESCAGWSRRPPLGSLGMKEVADYMLRNNYDLSEPPSTFAIDGRTYPLDNAMKIEFASVYEPSWIETNENTGQRTLRRSAVAAMMRHEIDLKLGDPLEKERKRQEDRNTFFETARLVNERF